MTEYQRKMRKLLGRPLGKREHEAWKYLAQGLTSRETSKKMKISENTVMSMRKTVYHKLGVHNIAGAVAKWYQEQMKNLKS
jgi:DNA-binding CsgD family transcriptional regulator